MLFWLNFSLANYKMLKDRLEVEEGNKNISLPSFIKKKKTKLM